MKIEIVSADGEIRIEETIPDSSIFLPTIEFETPDYQIQVANGVDGEYRVLNACNGWGNNCREDFKDAQINIFR